MKRFYDFTKKEREVARLEELVHLQRLVIQCLLERQPIIKTLEKGQQNDRATIN